MALSGADFKWIRNMSWKVDENNQLLKNILAKLERMTKK